MTVLAPFAGSVTAWHVARPGPGWTSVTGPVSAAWALWQGPGVQAGRARDETFIADWANNQNRKALLGSEFYPSFDTSSPPGCCPQSHEILLNTYWNSGLNAPGSRTFITTVHIAAVIGWRRSRKERTDGSLILTYEKLGTGGSLIPTYEKLGTGVFRCFLTHLCITHRVPTRWKPTGFAL